MCKQEGHVASYRGCPVPKKVQQARANLLKIQKIKNKNKKRSSAQSLDKAGITKTNSANPATQGQTKKRSYAQTIIETTTEKTKLDEQQGN